jgi:predicted transposase YbfD/YdcC
MMVKGNQDLLRRKIECFFANTTLFEAQFSRARTLDGGHGRIDTRSLLCSGDLPAGYLDFPHVAQVFCLTRTRKHKKSGKEEEETLYGLTSLPKAQASARRLLCLCRRHWYIENKSHRVRDVTLKEDASQVRVGSLPQVIATIRNVSVSLMRLAGHANIAAAVRFYAAQPKAALKLLGIGRTE